MIAVGTGAKMIERLMDALAELIDGDLKDSSADFNMLLELEFQQDLRCIRVLTATNPDERTPGQEGLLEILQTKYTRDGDCPSAFYARAAPHLQRRYWAIHTHICDALGMPR